MNISTVTALFYLGTFVTSFGGLLFILSVPTFFTNVGYSVEIIGLTIGVHRFSGLAATALFGPKIDHYNSKKVIIVTELLAAFSSLALIYFWQSRQDFGLVPFCTFIGVRAISVGIQGASRARLIKLLSENNETREASFAIWLNKVTQGAHVFSSLVAIPLLAHGNFLLAIAIDGISFLVGGYTAYILPNVDNEDRSTVSKKANILTAIHELYRRNKSIFIQDQILALTVSGSILFLVKLSHGDAMYIIYFNLLFGACVWLSSIVAHQKSLRNRTSIYWGAMSIGFISLIFTHETPLRFISYFLTYLGYWILYHKYTVDIQTSTPKESIGSTIAARGLALAFTLSMGEILGGYIIKILKFEQEILIRSVICLLMFTISSTFLNKKSLSKFK